MKLLSVVSPVYQNEDLIDQFVKTLYSVLSEADLDFEVILVNDGSTDATWTKMQELNMSFRQLVCVNLDRNYGQHKALMEGLRIARGDLIVVMDSDLEENPELILDLYAAHQETKKTVMILREKILGKNLGYRVLRSLFYSVFRKLIDFEYQIGVSNFGIYPKHLIQRILRDKSSYPFFPGLVSKFDSKVLYISSNQLNIPQSKSTYTLKSLVNHAIKVISSNSKRPLYLIFAFGVTASILAFLYGFGVLFHAAIFGSTISGWTSLALILSFGFSGVLLSLGIIAIYISSFIDYVTGPNQALINEVLPQERGPRNHG